MVIYKFGGTSVGNAERMKKVARLTEEESKPKVVVLSAVSGTTNALVAIGELLLKSDTKSADKLISALESEYYALTQALYSSAASLEAGKSTVDHYFSQMKALAYIPDFNEGNNKTLLAFGEILSTTLFCHYLDEQNIPNQRLSAFDFMSIDEAGEPEMEKISSRLKPLVQGHSLSVTQGFICKNHAGQTDNLKRGGSDYTASIIGAALKADEILIWTDIDGMHTNDPRIVEKTRPVSALTFDEAAELAYFGAKILHPTSILPAQKYDIPVRLKSTMDSQAPGTLIGLKSNESDIKAIAAKDHITAIKIKSSRMLLAHGFLKNIFEVFSDHKTPIDMVTTSEVAVSLTIDDDKKIKEITDGLRKFGKVESDTNQTIICIVGNMVSEKSGVLKKIFDVLSEIPVRMVSYGGSKHNISLLIDSEYKVKALNKLNEGLF